MQPGRSGTSLGDELLNRPEQVGIQPNELKEVSDGLTDFSVIVDYDDRRFLGPAVSDQLPSSHCALGRVRWKTLPRFSPGVTQRRPLCASTIDRQIGNPIPMPWFLVVKNGSKI